MATTGPRRILIKACLNGNRSRAEHPAVPLTPEELAEASQQAGAAGAGAVHVHPRRPDGAETLDADACGAVVAAIRATCPGVPVGLTTGAWIEPDLRRRLEAIAGWRVRPDFASVNLSEEGAGAVCRALREIGVGIEAGLSTLDDARALVESGLGPDCLHILIEVEEEDPAAAVALAQAIDAEIERGGISAPQLHHGVDRATWAVLDAALARGRDVRIGLEDTLVRPDGSPARDNAELVALAVETARRHGVGPMG